ncbi:unnamed protein product [Phytophthora fragariaefolia]|uniref:Unnamed protein product n=1 Tax=Phytophthora fragariaefolia TaxID=1490495 RepID=A0A9W6YCB8_9STRA|nr:unnamed protein product [Phytophthora fragariaefolia]
MVATCAQTTFLSAAELGYEEQGYGDDEDDEDADAQCSESDHDLSDLLDDGDMDHLDDDDDDYPKLRVAQPPDEPQDEVGELSSVSAWSFDSDSQTSSTVKDTRRRSVSFGPLPLADLAEENAAMASPRPMALEELSDGEHDG